MTENFYHRLLNFLILFIQCFNIEKAKDDARKIGITFGGAGLLGGMIGHYSHIEMFILITTGIMIWLSGLYDQEV